MLTRDDVKVPLGEGWKRLAAAASDLVPAGEVDAVWVFRALRHEQREWGTAVLSRVDGERRRVYTARYVHTIKGKERGRYSAVVEEVGAAPPGTVEDLIRLVEKRADDEFPESVDPAAWFEASDDAAAG